MLGGMPINGIITRLPSFFETEIQNVWNDFQHQIGISRIKTTSFPHLTWVIAKHTDEDLVDHQLNIFRKKITPFVFSTNGIGVFTGKRPAVYIQIKPDIRLLAFQNQLYDLFSDHSEGLKKFYAPDRWIPHISVAIEDIDTSNIGRVMEYLLPKSFKHDIRIEYFTLVRKELGKNMEIVRAYRLSGE
jgi:hypothetical protein